MPNPTEKKAGDDGFRRQDKGRGKHKKEEGSDDDEEEEEEVEFVVDCSSVLKKENKLFGFYEDDAMQQTAYKQLEDAIDLLPSEEKSSFLRARGASPDLIWKESNPIRYLRFDSFNPWVAARRLTTYWTIREEVFGSELAFRPLNLFDYDVFGRESPIEEVFERECVVFLPPDKEGRVSVYVDRSKLAHPDRIRPRSCFMLFQMIAENENSDYVFIIKLENPLDASFQREEIRLASDLAMHALPIRHKRVHFMCTPPRRGPDVVRSFLDFIVPLALRRLGRFFAKEPIVHVVNKTEEMLPILLPYGYKAEGLPPALGGTWNADRWYETYRRIEPVNIVQGAPGKNQPGSPVDDNIAPAVAEAAAAAAGSRDSPATDSFCDSAEIPDDDNRFATSKSNVTEQFGSVRFGKGSTTAAATTTTPIARTPLTMTTDRGRKKCT